MKINTGEYQIRIKEIKNIVDTENLNSKKSKNVEKNDICEVVIHSILN